MDETSKQSYRQEVMTDNLPPIDLERLLRLRLVVARHGEMDRARWWNTQGILGHRGRVVLKRGFPATHYFAQARIAFAVASYRCKELFAPPGCMTLWHLPAELADLFEESWLRWLDQGEEWNGFFERLSSPRHDGLLEELLAFGLITQQDVEAVKKLRRSAESRAVLLPGTHSPKDEVLTLLAAGFERGEPGKPAIPYARLESV